MYLSLSVHRTFSHQLPLLSFWDVYYKTLLLDTVQILIPVEKYETLDARAWGFRVGLILPCMNDAIITTKGNGGGAKDLYLKP